MHSQLNKSRYAVFDLIIFDGIISSLFFVLSHVARVPAASCSAVAAMDMFDYDALDVF